MKKHIGIAKYLTNNFFFLLGHEYQAVVEYAPFQRIARSKSNSSKKKNSKCGTIESDPYFIEFKKNLQEEREKAGSRSFKQHYFETNTESKLRLK